MLATTTIAAKKRESELSTKALPYEGTQKDRPSFVYGADNLVTLMSTTDMNFDTLHQATKDDGVPHNPVPDQPQPMLKCAPEVVDDYIRNFLLRNGMLRTLEMFEFEWYERFGNLNDTEKAPLFLVPDNYVENASLLNRIEELEHNLRRHAELTTKTTKQWLQAKKDCEFHRIHHSRVVQEKNKLSKLLKQSHRHAEGINPTIVELRQRYEGMLKAKTLVTLEKEKLEQRVNDLELQLSVLQSQQKPKERKTDQGVKSTAKTVPDGVVTGASLKTIGSSAKTTQGMIASSIPGTRRNGEVRSPTASVAIHAKRETISPPREGKNAVKFKLHTPTDRSNGPPSAPPPAAASAFQWPADERARPAQMSSLPHYACLSSASAASGEAQLQKDTQTEASQCPLPPLEWTCQSSFVAHTMPVTNISLHQRKPAVASCSDDGTWKLWTLPQGELILSGSHKNWVSSVAMHPTGTMAATGSGDKTLKLWDFATNRCSTTLVAHTDGVWCVDFQETGRLLASGALDYTARVWDVERGLCLHSLRGHMDGVNSVRWLPYTNLLCTGSGDKTVSVWDARMNFCANTLYGHRNAVRCVVPLVGGSSSDSDTALVSCDAEGVVKVWDLRRMEPRQTVSCAPGAANCLAVDGTGRYIGVAMDDGRIRMLRLALGGHDKSRDESSNGKNLNARDLLGHEGPVQCIAFDPSTSGFLVSCGSDGTIRYWS
ncbi:unnamed protein product [Phytomonas sp. EM1]|nr:unnamed protein product [Phytomonas sp. EM1]|eukprot:CCW61240.1 unnamed protein product [Phytomonas sp. isolate EM1]